MQLSGDISRSWKCCDKGLLVEKSLGDSIALEFFCPARPEITGIWSCSKENLFASGI